MHTRNPSLRCWLCWLIGALALSFLSFCSTVQAAPATESASGLLDDLGEGLFGPSESPPPAERTTPNLKSQGLPPTDQPPRLTPPAGEDLGQPSESNPLANIAEKMQQAEQLIVRQNLTGQTAQVQEQVLSDLDALIAQSQQQNQSQSSSQSQSQSQPQQTSQRSTPQPSQGSQAAGQRAPGAPSAAQTSSDRLGPGAVDEAAGQGPQELLKDVWGQLPERVRQQLLQSSTDEFLPQYREEIERYFRRLAEEESGAASPTNR